MGGMKWRKVGGKPEGQFGDHDDVFLGWDEEGTKIEGVFKGITQGRYGPLGLIKDSLDNSTKSFSMPTVLKRKLEAIANGSYIKIEYLGTAVSRSGREYKNFEVYIGDDAAT